MSRIKGAGAVVITSTGVEALREIADVVARIEQKLIETECVKVLYSNAQRQER